MYFYIQEKVLNYLDNHKNELFELLSELFVIYQYGDSISFNAGLYKDFGEYGGPHQIDEHVDCDKFLAITKALALYLIEKSYNKQ